MPTKEAATFSFQLIPYYNNRSSSVQQLIDHTSIINENRSYLTPIVIDQSKGFSIHLVLFVIPIIFKHLYNYILLPVSIS